MSTSPAKPQKRMPPGSVSLQIAGDLILPRCSDTGFAGLFRRYEAVFEHFANMERGERVLNFKFLNGLILTSHAKKTKDVQQKKHLFDLKNNLYLSIANNREVRRSVAFRYLVSKNFRVLEFCSECIAKNTAEEVERHQWKHCAACKLDRSFYNVLSMHHKFKDGSATLFLSNDLVERIQGLNLKSRGKLEDHKETAEFGKYQYNVRNLDAIALDSCLKMYEMLIKV